MRLTGPARTIVDVAETGGAPEQVVRAAQRAADRGMTTPGRLREAAHGRGRRVEQLVEIALAGTSRCGTPRRQPSAEVQIAEKVHAYTRGYGQSGIASTRVKDLVDLALIASACHL